MKIRFVRSWDIHAVPSTEVNLEGFVRSLRIIFLGLFIVFFPTQNTVAEGIATVYFVPFEVETYVPITRATIVSQAWEKWTISKGREIAVLVKMLTHGPAESFDENRVRALVIRDTQMYYVDSEGVVSNRNVNIKIDKTEFLKFRDSLKSEQRKKIRGG